MAAPPVSQALAIVVHATVVLLIGQVIVTPLHYVRESLTSPLNLAAVLPLMDDGTLPARFFGSLDIFVLWWCGATRASAWRPDSGTSAVATHWPLGRCIILLQS